MNLIIPEHLNERGHIWLTNGDDHVAWFLLNGNTENIHLKCVFLQVSICPLNYPGFTIDRIELSPVELARHICDKCDGWTARKLNHVPNGSVVLDQEGNIHGNH